MKKNSIFIFLLIFIFSSSCKTQKPVSTPYKDAVEISMKKSYPSGEKIEIVLNNISGSDLVLYKPSMTEIEKQENGAWKNVRILYCPCGASCPPPADKITIPKAGKHLLNWNQLEKWCGAENHAGIPKTESKTVAAGNYRIKIGFMAENKKRQIIYHEFTIQ